MNPEKNIVNEDLEIKPKNRAKSRTFSSHQRFWGACCGGQLIELIMSKQQSLA
jgi:hypothetical protein